jgi:uncharacterized membrane protein YqjE
MAKVINTEPAPPFSRLPGLFEKLGQTLGDFVEAKLALFRKEMWEEGEALVNRAAGIVAAALVAWAGFLVVSAGLVLALDEWLRNPVLSAMIVGVVYLAGGLGIVKLQMKNLRRPLTKTQTELEKDKLWIRANT